MTEHDFDLARQDSYRWGPGPYPLQAMVQGEPAITRADVALAMHAVFPNLAFSYDDIAEHDPEEGMWLVPVPRTVALLASQGEVFAWTEDASEHMDPDGDCLVSVIVVDGTLEP